MKDDKGEVIKGHPVKVLAKSGTLNFVSGLAGHVVAAARGGSWSSRSSPATPSGATRCRSPCARSRRAASAWTKRARRLQGQLINRWAGAYA